MPGVKKTKVAIRRFAGRQKRNLIYRVINPARYCFDLARFRLASGHAVQNASRRPIRVALVSDLDATGSEHQFDPFSTYRFNLRQELRLISLHLLLKDVLRAPKLLLSGFDIIVLKMSFRTSPSKALHAARTVRLSLNNAHLIYFDGDDDLGIQWPEILPYVDLYIKKHIFSDKLNYLKQYVGKSNLTDYVHHKYGYSFSARDYGNSRDGYTMISESGPVPFEQLCKIRLGFNLALDHNIVKLRDGRQHRLAHLAKQTDVIFRGSVAQENWSYYLRKDVEPILRRLGKKYRVLTPNKRVTLEEYYREMGSSKICISPFGYGEICWRDFEAMLCGCLVIKPNMSHVETNPDIFKPFKTYVPVEWNFSDLENKCVHYLTHEGERQRIVTDALKNLEVFYENDGFIEFISKMLYSLTDVARTREATFAFSGADEPYPATSAGLPRP